MWGESPGSSLLRAWLRTWGGLSFMSRGSRGYEAGEVCNDLAHIYGDNPLPCHHSGRFFSLIPLGHYRVAPAFADSNSLDEHLYLYKDCAVLFVGTGTAFQACLLSENNGGAGHGHPS